MSKLPLHGDGLRRLLGPNAHPRAYLQYAKDLACDGRLRTLYVRAGRVNRAVGARCDKCGHVLWREKWQPAGPSGSNSGVYDDDIPF